MSSSNQVTVRYVPEVTPGTTPADDAGWKELGFISENLTASPQTNEIDEINSDRMDTDLLSNGYSVSGGVQGRLRYSMWDDFMEAALGGTWTTNVLKVGAVSRHFSFEKEFGDLTNKFLAFKGMKCSSAQMNFDRQNGVTMDFQFMGLSTVTDGSSSLVGSGSSASPTTNEIMNAAGDVGTINVGGAGSTICFRNISLNINNNVQPRMCMGSEGPSAVTEFASRITGSLEVYLDDDAFAWLSSLIDQTTEDVEWTVTDGTNTYTFNMPKIKFSGQLPVIGGGNQEIMLPLDFTVLKDSGTGSTLDVTRSG